MTPNAQAKRFVANLKRIREQEKCNRIQAVRIAIERQELVKAGIIKPMPVLLKKAS